MSYKVNSESYQLCSRIIRPVLSPALLSRGHCYMT
jgi:hypothetical protein